MRRLVNYMLMYALSPVGTLLNTGMLVVALLMIGADPKKPLFWVSVAIFVGASGLLDLRAYLARRRRGFTAYQATEAVTDAIWGPRQRPQPDEDA